jgi:hypothetical protein
MRGIFSKKPNDLFFIVEYTLPEISLVKYLLIAKRKYTPYAKKMGFQGLPKEQKATMIVLVLGILLLPLVRH